MQVPGRTYFTERVIPGIYKRTRMSIESQIKVASYLSFTTDIWTSDHNAFAFISLSGHWLTQEFKAKHAVLNCKYFPGSHTGNAIQGVIELMMREWGIGIERVHLLLRYVN